MISSRSAILGFVSLVAGLVAVGPAATPCSGQTASNVADPFTGKIVFHQKESHISYEVTITDGEVGGRQLLGATPIAKIVGGWFDYKKGHLSLLLQGATEALPTEWRSQCQQFSIDPTARVVKLEHMLYSFGATLDTPQPLATTHVLDSFDASVHLTD